MNIDNVNFPDNTTIQFLTALLDACLFEVAL
jgi:hypothetical protein